MYKSSTGGRLRRIAESKNASAPETFNEDGNHSGRATPAPDPIAGRDGAEYRDDAEGMTKAGSQVRGPSPFGKLTAGK